MKRNQNVTRFHSQHAPIKHSNGTRMTMMMMIIRMCNEVVCAELYLAAWAGLCHKGKGSDVVGSVVCGHEKLLQYNNIRIYN